MKSKVLENKQQAKEKTLSVLRKSIDNAESKKSLIDADLETAISNSNIEQYQKSLQEKNDLELFIQKTKEKIAQTKAENICTDADLETIKSELQSEYNPKLQKAFKTFSDALSKAMASYDNYKNITDDFLKDRNQFNALTGNTKSVYDGDNKIQNDYSESVSTTMQKIRLFLNNPQAYKD
ncbi:MAG: hypothetical protein EOM05_01700 [Clostridia bacterium]|nr:hypothetical protein [Clostridia bacterium]